MRLRRAAAVLTLPALACLLLAGCEAPPQITFQDMDVQQLSAEQAEYVAVFNLANPNDHPYQIDEVRWTLTAGGFEIARATVGKSTELAASKVTPLPVYVAVPAQAVAEAGLANEKSFDYQLDGQVRLYGPFGPIVLPLHTHGQMPVVHRLQVALSKVERLSTSETRVGLALHLAMTNPNEVAVIPLRLKGYLLINDRPLVAVDLEFPEGRIGPGQTISLRKPAWVFSPEVGVASLDKMLATPGAALRLLGDVTFRLPRAADVRRLATQPDTQADTQPD